MLYLIFLAGLQLDLEVFVRYRVISGGFGLLTAVMPMALGTGAAVLLGVDMRPAILIGSFWASFTLIAYPTVARYGLTKTAGRRLVPVRLGVGERPAILFRHQHVRRI